MIEREGYVYLPNSEANKCFGCGPANPCGLKMEFYTDRKSIVSWLAVPEHLSGWDNIAHGGIVSTILDEIMGRAVIVLLKSLPITKSMKIDFLKPVFVGMDLKAVGRVIEKREREALLEGIIFDRDGQACARTEATFGLFSIESMKKRGIMPEQITALFENLSSLEI